MSTVLLIIQLIISIILTGLILIQRSEGGALGIGGGGGGGGGGLMSGRSAATSIVRMTAILGALFIINCLALSVVYQIENRDNSVLDDTPAEVTQSETAPLVDETATEVLTSPDDSSETSVPSAEETLAEDAGPKQGEKDE